MGDLSQVGITRELIPVERTVKHRCPLCRRIAFTGQLGPGTAVEVICPRRIEADKNDCVWQRRKRVVVSKTQPRKNDDHKNNNDR